MDRKLVATIDYLAKCLAVVCWDSKTCPFKACPLGHGQCKNVTDADWVNAAATMANFSIENPEGLMALMAEAKVKYFDS